MNTRDTRTESDLLGSIELPEEALYGINTWRGVKNLTVSDRTVGSEREFVKAFALAKKAGALANAELKQLDHAITQAISLACDEVASGIWDEEFIVDVLEGSGGTSTNMNFNEVIARRASQLSGENLYVHPNDHVNRSQSTNDVYPAAMKIATYALLGPLISEVKHLALAFRRHQDELADVLHLGRTCMQDAQPMYLGQTFGGYASLTERLAQELESVRDKLRVLPLGGTAIGTGFGAPGNYRDHVYRHLQAVTGVRFIPAADSFDAMQNLDAFVRVSGELRVTATSLGKIASDLIVLSSGPQAGIGEIVLPTVQAGSSIMPGKVNPVVAMSMVQLGFAVVGNDVTVAQANQAGQLEINHFEPVVADRVFDSIHLLTRGVALFRTRCIEGLRAVPSVCESHLMASSAIATALVPSLGYAETTQLVQRANQEGITLVELLDRESIMRPDEALALARAACNPAPV